MKSILNACPLFAINFFVARLGYYYQLFLRRTLVRPVIQLGTVQQVYNCVTGFALSLRGWRTVIARNEAISWDNI